MGFLFVTTNLERQVEFLETIGLKINIRGVPLES